MADRPLNSEILNLAVASRYHKPHPQACAGLKVSMVTKIKKLLLCVHTTNCSESEETTEVLQPSKKIRIEPDEVIVCADSDTGIRRW